MVKYPIIQIPRRAPFPKGLRGLFVFMQGPMAVGGMRSRIGEQAYLLAYCMETLNDKALGEIERLQPERQSVDEADARLWITGELIPLRERDQ